MLTHISIRSSAIAEGLRDVLVSYKCCKYKTSHFKMIASTNDLEVYTPQVIVIAAFK